MTKRAALTNELEKKSGKPPRPERAPDKAPGAYSPPSRAGKITFAIHVAPAVRNQMKLIALEEGRTVQDLTSEALNLVFAAYKKPLIAEVLDGRTMPVVAPEGDAQ